MARIGIVADVHGDWVALQRWIRATGVSAVLCAGDLVESVYEVKWHAPLHFVAGNHDNRRFYDHKRRHRKAERTHLIDDWTTIEVDGLVVLGVGAAYSTWMGGGPCRTVAPPADLVVPRADVVLSHAPGFSHLLDRDEGRGIEDWIEPLVARAIAESGARWAFSGHEHVPARGRVGDCACYALGMDAHEWAVLDADAGTVAVGREALPEA